MKHILAILVGFAVTAAIVGAAFGIIRVLGDAAIIIGLVAIGVGTMSYGIGRAIIEAFASRYLR